MFRFLCVALAAAVTLSAPSDESLEKFEEQMKKKLGDAVLNAKQPIETIPLPTDAPALPDLNLHDLASTIGVPTDPTGAPDDVSDLLANLHEHIHDVHSSVHNVLDDTMKHPGLQPTVKALNLDEHPKHEADEAATDNALADLLKVGGGSQEDADAADSETGETGKATDSKPEEDTEDSKPETGKVDSDADAAPDAGEMSGEQEQTMAGMKQLMGAVKMIVMLQPMLEPLKEKLEMAMDHMSPEDAKKADSILKHIKALDVYSKVTAGLMAGVIAAKKGTEEDRQKAVATLIVGVKQIQEKVAMHLSEMKQETKAMKQPEDGEAGEAPEAPHPQAGAAMDKMTALLVKLGKKIAQEIKDPANKHNPKVLLDIKLFLAVKDSVEKTQALMMAGSIAIKKAKTEDEKAAVQAAVKRGMTKVEMTLKTKMKALEKQALLLAVAAAKQHEDAEQGEQDEAPPTEDDAEEEHPHKKRHPKPSHADDEDDADVVVSEKKRKGSVASAKEAKDDDASADADSDDADAEVPKPKKGPKKSPTTHEDEDADDAEEAPKPHKRHGDDDEEDEMPQKHSHRKSESDEASSSEASAEDTAKKNHPDISPSDIEHIFEESADEATSDKKKGEASLLETGVPPHLRTH